MRIGFGFDLHSIRHSAKGSLLLAGVRIPAPYQVTAHSDGDLLFHAVSDALRSACGATDIGEAFPPGSSKTQGINSRRILENSIKEVAKIGATVQSASVVIAAESPQLGPHRAKIQEALAEALGVRADRVGISFKTFEGLAPFAKKAVACWAACLLEEK